MQNEYLNSENIFSFNYDNKYTTRILHFWFHADAVFEYQSGCDEGNHRPEKTGSFIAYHLRAVLQLWQTIYEKFHMTLMCHDKLRQDAYKN